MPSRSSASSEGRRSLQRVVDGHPKVFCVWTSARLRRGGRGSWRTFRSRRGPMRRPPAQIRLPDSARHPGISRAGKEGFPHLGNSVRPSVPSSFTPASPSSRTGTGRVCCPRNEPAGTLTTPASGERLISSRGIDSVYMCRDNVHRTFPNRHMTMCLDFGQHKGRPCGRRLTRNPPWKCFCGVCVCRN